MEEVDVTIIGAGVVGLAITAQIADSKRSVFVLERNNSFGQETSSRNSQVIHSGIYYPQGSLKTRACVEGNRLLYQICSDNGIPCRKLTKLVVATSEEDIGKLELLAARGRKNGVDNLELLTKSQVNKIEPNVTCLAALLVPDTGILDVHDLMRFFLRRSLDQGTQIVYRSEVIGIERRKNGYKVSLSSGGDEFSFVSRVVINSAGLAADKVASLAGIDPARYAYKLYYCKGEYFSVNYAKKGLVSRLVYPIPPDKLAGVGIHVTLDIGGRIRLGPGIKYITDIDYKVDEDGKRFFYEGVRKMLPGIELEDLEPEMCGIRPKLQGPDDEPRDFVISHEIDKGFPGLINLIGIESPGLTSSPAIAGIVRNMVDLVL